MKSVTEFSPAKINLFLAVTGRREDGYHELVSVVAPLDFGDELGAEESGKETGDRRQETGGRGQGARDRRQEVGESGEGTGGAEREMAGDGSVRPLGARGDDDTGFGLECDNPAVPVDGSNLVLRAAAAFTATRGFGGKVHFKLTKRIPIGAGLGGGSSNGVAALRAMNALTAHPLAEPELEEIAAGLGSDCALFLRRAPVIMRGRGERVDALPESAALRLRGRRVLLFKPSFAIATAWAYRRLAERAADYVAAPEAEARLAAWANGQRPAEELLFNTLEPVAFEKYPALPLLLARLRREFGVAAGMSGSGSACFALLPGEGGPDAAEEIVTQMTRRIRECWGPAAWLQSARIL